MHESKELISFVASCYFFFTISSKGDEASMSLLYVISLLEIVNASGKILFLLINYERIRGTILILRCFSNGIGVALES